MTAGWLQGRTGVVTGASRGIGRAVAESLARAGMRTFLAARSADDLEEAAKLLRDEGHDATAVPTDVSDPAAVEKLFATLDTPDVLVCAAGILEKATIDETTADLWNRTIATNLTGAFLCCRAAFARMRSGDGGRMVMIGSLSGVYATEKFPGLAAYNVSKYGIVGLTESIAVEGREHDISAICISPGAVDTEMLRTAAPHLKPGLQPEDVGRLIVGLLNEDIGPLSGANIPLFSNR